MPMAKVLFPFLSRRGMSAGYSTTLDFFFFGASWTSGSGAGSQSPSLEGPTGGGDDDISATEVMKCLSEWDCANRAVKFGQRAET